MTVRQRVASLLPVPDSVVLGDPGDSAPLVVTAADSGGSAAEASAPRLAQSGLDVLVLEPADVGGECPFTACIPSKALLTPARALYEATQSQGVSSPEIDPAEVFKLRDRVTSGGSDAQHVASLEAAGVLLSRSHGRISGPGKVELIEEDRTVHARRAGLT